MPRDPCPAINLSYSEKFWPEEIEMIFTFLQDIFGLVQILRSLEISYRETYLFH